MRRREDGIFVLFCFYFRGFLLASCVFYPCGFVVCYSFFAVVGSVLCFGLVSPLSFSFLFSVTPRDQEVQEQLCQLQFPSVAHLVMSGSMNDSHEHVRRTTKG